MSRQIQIRRGSTAQHATFTGKIAEVTFDTDAKTLRVHDNEQVGGYPLARQSELDAADYVIASQLPTPSNNYTWYRKYKSGWVEQGGIKSTGALNLSAASVKTVSLPIKMAHANYHATAAPCNNDTFSRLFASFGHRTQTTMQVGVRNAGDAVTASNVCWSVSGMSD